MSESYLTQLEACSESLPGERWLPVSVGCDEASKYFFVSSCGRLLSKERRNRTLPSAGFGLLGASLMHPSRNRRGYFCVCMGIVKVYGLSTQRVHQLVLRAFTPPQEHSEEINHIDGNKANNRLDNLEWSNRSENLAHAFRLGLCKPLRGQASPRAKLTARAVRELKAVRRAGVSAKKLAVAYGIAEGHCRGIIRGETWRDA